ncbi:MAG: thrombospondin type 3 repeat-containing protein [Myxococcales bacterium]|nr:thrombospondin type 3 repeat-containing protein [Myxococcales bacterium]
MAAATAMPGCITDPDCGICDPENLILETIAASNFAGKEIYVLSPECKGDACPEPLTEAKFYVNTISQCEVSEDAVNEDAETGKNLRSEKEWCRISPLIVGAGINFIFNNLLDPQSIELVRKQLANPNLFEVYDWKTRILKITGPTSRYNGDYYKGSNQNPDVITRAVNLSCIDNFADLGVPFDHNALNSKICDDFFFDGGGKLWPLRTRLGQEIKAYSGKTDWRSGGNSCEAPDEGPDTCCTACDFELSVNVSRYGAGGFDGKTACDPMADDKFVACRNVTTAVDRASEDPNRYKFDWNGEYISSPIPKQDLLRETHPDDRPAGSEQKNVPCNSNSDCTSATNANLPGTECVGELENSGNACSKDSAGEACVNKHCVAEWFVTCGTTQAGGFCVDKRFSDNGTAGCFEAAEAFTANSPTLMETRNVGKGKSLALADIDENGLLDTDEACDGGACDPFYQRAVPVNTYDRKKTLPERTRSCVCPRPGAGSQDGSESEKYTYAWMRKQALDSCVSANSRKEDDDPSKLSEADALAECSQDESWECFEVLRDMCKDGDKWSTTMADRYATRFVTQNGGVIYDPSVKGVAFRAADVGSVRRAFAESCAQGRSNIGAFNIKDGWRANDSSSETDENFDRAMCSSSDYEIVFALPEDSDVGADGQYIQDKVGNTLKGRRTYRFTTPDFHIVPGSGFPSDNLRIGACDDFEIGFSNKYDMSPHNLQKLQIVELDDMGNEVAVVAGGLSCTEDPEQVSSSKPPCLTVNVRSQLIGKVGVFVNPKDFGQVLQTGRTYRLKVPGLDFESFDKFREFYATDAAGAKALYEQAFWDACGMPLILGGVRDPNKPDHHYDFSIDLPKAKEDKDGVLGQSFIGPDAMNTCDRQGDAVQFSCDNAPNHYNPGQEDSDLDGFGDVYDLCPTIETAINTADADKDGVGNECDVCSKLPSAYNKEAAKAGVPPYLLVYNTPYQGDADGDGVGDACDNCVMLANCGDFGNEPGQTPFEVGDVAPTDNTNICQTDIDTLPMIGDACVDQGVPITFPGAAGPVGFGNDDDFDGDGLRNIVDFCPRIPITKVMCNDDSECPGSECTDGMCNHSDSDGDKVGNDCDTCPYDVNPGQIADGGIQDDDEDGDFVGRVCETDTACVKRLDPRPFAFYDVSANGWCCTVIFDEISQTRAPKEPYLVDVDESGNVVIVGGGRPLKVDCPDENDPTCRKLPDSVINRPGMVTLPAGCEEALTAAGYDWQNKVYAKRLALADVGGDESALWANRCTLPQWDQDFDGVGDTCDLCPFAFDPDNEPYVNENGRLYPEAGKYCNGNYDIDKIDEALKALQPTCYEAEGETGGMMETGGMETGG